VDYDRFIIRNLPLFLADSARAWLEHLLARRIHNWADLMIVFGGNFQSTYVHPGNPWDLRSNRQKPGETLCEYIQRFSLQCTELPNVTDVDVIGAFLVGTTCKELVHELGRKGPCTAKELLDIATNFASSKEAVGAIFHNTKGKEKRQEDTDEGGSGSNSKKKKKTQQSRKDLLVAAAERKNPQAPP
jgi:hypothetical protein